MQEKAQSDRREMTQISRAAHGPEASARGRGRRLLLPRRASRRSRARAHGMAVIGDLKYAAGLSRISTTSTSTRRRGGRIVTQLPHWGFNQNPQTFNTLNIYVLARRRRRGHGAHLRQPDGRRRRRAGQRSTASSRRRSRSPTTARRSASSCARGRASTTASPLTADDVAFSLETLRTRAIRTSRRSCWTGGESTARTSTRSSSSSEAGIGRSLPITVAGTADLLACLVGRTRFRSLASAKRRSARAPTRSAISAFGSYIEFERVADWWADDLPVMPRRYNFDVSATNIYRDRTASFEAFKKGSITFREEFTSRHWATGYDFPAVTDGRVIKDDRAGRRTGRSAGLVHQHAAAEIRRPARRAWRSTYAFDFEWINKNLMFGSYAADLLFFENSPLKAEGKPTRGGARAARAAPRRGAGGGVRRGVRAAGLRRLGPRPRDAAEGERASARRPAASARAAACARRTATPFTIEFLDDDPIFEPHASAYIAER